MARMATGNEAHRPADLRRGPPAVPGRVGAVALTVAIVGGVAVLAGTAPTAAAGVVLGILATAVFSASDHARALAGVLLLASAPVIGGFADVTNDVPAALRLFDDAVLAGGVALLAFNAHLLPPEARRLGGFALAALVLSELAGVAAAHSGPLTALSAAWQDLRWLGIFGWGLWLASSLSADDRVRCAYFVAVGWAGLTAVISVAQVALGMIEEYRLSIPTAAGLFSHPVPGSLAGVMAITFAIADHQSEKPVLTPHQRRIAFFVGLAAVMVTLRFQAILVVGAVLLLSLLRRHAGPVASGVVVATIPILITGSLLAISAATSQFGVIAPADSASSAVIRDVTTHAPSRVRLSQGALRLAGEQVPFGWGLGTYGSGLESALESEAFQSAGLLGFYGFRDTGPDYRSDNFVAHVLAERGYLGLGLWFLALVLLVATALAGSRHLLPAAALAGVVATSPFGPAFKSAPYMMIIMFVGALLLYDAGEPEPLQDQ